MIGLVVACKFLAIATEPLAGAILQHFTVKVFENVETGLRRRQIRLADIEMVDVNTALLGGVSKWG